MNSDEWVCGLCAGGWNNCCHRLARRDLASLTYAIEANQYNYASIIASDLLLILEHIKEGARV